MKVVILGNFQVSHSSETHHARSLEALGHEVVRLQEGMFRGDRILQDSLDADLFVWIHSHGWVPVAQSAWSMSDVLDDLSTHGVKIITYHLDLYVGIAARWAEYKYDPYMQKLDHFFTADPKLVTWMESAQTMVKGHWLPPGVVADECYMAQPGPLYYPIVFVGSYHYHPTWPYREKLIDWLKDTYGRMLFTGFGPHFPPGVVRGDRLNRVYASSKIVVGDTYSPDFNYPLYWSDRIPETLGRGGFLIHPRIKGIEEHFEDRKHLVLYDYNDFDQLQSLIDYYLTHDAEREAIRLAGHEHVKAHHTYTHRWAHIIREVFGGCS